MARGLQIFRRSAGVDLDDTKMMGRPVMEPTPSREVFKAIGATAGYVIKVLFGDPDTPGMSLIRLWYAPDYALPRHSHDVDCLYYVISGEARMGNQVIPAGDGFFVPAGAPYAYAAGPDGVEVLEFRGATSFGINVTESLGRWDQLADLARTHKDDWIEQTAEFVAQ